MHWSDSKELQDSSEEKAIMKTDNFVAGLIVITFAAILFADAILTTLDPASQLFSHQ